MKLIIEIPDELYEHVIENTEDTDDEYHAIVAIRHGIPVDDIRAEIVGDKVNLLYRQKEKENTK